MFEKVKNFLKISKKEEEPDIDQDKVLTNLSDESQDLYATTGAFFDSEYSTIFNTRDKSSLLEKQKAKIMLYRNLSKNTDVNNAIEEIVNEVSFTQDNKVLQLYLDEENEKIKEAIENKFNKILRLTNIEKSIYNIVRQGYIDGQIILHCQYNENLDNGIKAIRMLEPVYFYYDKNTEVYKYYNKDSNFFKQTGLRKNETYPKEEIIKETFGLIEDQLNLSYLEYAIKPANQLKILEDLLIPMRFSRSVSRRVFNVDVGELSPAKAEEAMKEIQQKFKYKKFYNTDTGEITNQQHITSMVEDYWFANRSGAKGTTVDTIDETGNLGEINDILYFQKKLYKAMNIPLNRISGTDMDNTFDYDSSSVTKDDMKFYMFVNRLRQVYINVFNELLKRELISSGILTVNDYNIYKEKIKIKFSAESLFIEKMKISQFQNKLDIYSNVQEYNGKLFPVETILKDIFKFSDEEIEDNFKKIEQEKKDPKFAAFYSSDDDY